MKSNEIILSEEERDAFERWLYHRPSCSQCGKAITDDSAPRFYGQYICFSCIYEHLVNLKEQDADDGYKNRRIQWLQFLKNLTQ